MEDQGPINKLPAIVVVLVLIMAGIELALSAGAGGFIGGPTAIGWRLKATEGYAFAPSVIEYMSAYGWAFEAVKRFFTYPFIHASTMDAVFGAVLTLALGKFVGDIFGSFATFVLFLISAVVGALVFGLIVTQNVPLIGAYPPAYGLIGAYTYVIWLRLGQTGENQLAAFRLIGFLLAIQLVFGALFGGSPTWIAELAGFGAGFAVAPLLAPGGWRAFVARMRAR